jgi:hypothetical protein
VGLAGTGAAGDQRVHPAAADDLQDLGTLRRDRAETLELVQGQLVTLELADRERRPVDGERRGDDVDARAVRQAGVADRARFVDAAADLADDALADIEQLLIVAEAYVAALDLALHFDVHGVGAVHHNVGDVVARQKRLQRAITQHIVADILEQFLLLGDRHHDVLDRDDLVDDVADLLARGRCVEPSELAEVDCLDERAEDLALGLVEAVRTTRRRRRHGHRRVRIGRGRDRDSRLRLGGTCGDDLRRRSWPADR